MDWAIKFWVRTVEDTPIGLTRLDEFMLTHYRIFILLTFSHQFPSTLRKMMDSISARESLIEHSHSLI